MSFTLAEAKAADAADPLRSLRERFHLPDGVIYLDGNSLGPLPKAVAPHQREVVEREWADGLIRSWNSADWINAPQRVGAAPRLAGFTGSSLRHRYWTAVALGL